MMRLLSDLELVQDLPLPPHQRAGPAQQRAHEAVLLRVRPAQLRVLPFLLRRRSPHPRPLTRLLLRLLLLKSAGLLPPNLRLLHHGLQARVRLAEGR